MTRIALHLVLIWGLGTAAASIDLDSLLVQSVGGPEAVETLRRMVSFRGEGSAVLNGMPGRFTECFAPPDRFYMELDLGGLQMVQGYDGRIAWQIDYNGNVTELEGFEKDELLKGLFFSSHSYLFEDRIPGGCEYRGVVERDGHNYHEVAFYPLNADTVTAYYDMESSYLAGTVGNIDELKTTTTYGDYRFAGPLLWAYSSTMSAEGAPLSLEYTYDTIIVDGPLDRSIFAKADRIAGDFAFPDGMDSVVVPFVYHAGHIRLPAIVNGTHKVWLILDSGASASFIDKSLSERLELTPLGSMAAKGMSAYQEVQMIRTDSIAVGGLTLIDQVAGVLDLSMLARAGGEDMPFGGLLGYDFLSRFPILINYRDSLITVYRPGSAVSREGGSEIEFFLTLKIPTIVAELNGIPGDFIIDLGNAFGLIIHSRFATTHDLHGLLDDIRETPQALSGVGGSVEGKTAYAASFKMGDVLIQSLRVILPDSAQGIAGSGELAGNVGNLLLENFDVLFDYNNSRMILYDADKE